MVGCAISSDDFLVLMSSRLLNLIKSGFCFWTLSAYAKNSEENSNPVLTCFLSLLSSFIIFNGAVHAFSKVRLSGDSLSVSWLL